MKIGTLRDNMSNEMEAFCIEHGIEGQHSVRNRPQQNSVAERFNRVLSEGITLCSLKLEAGVRLSLRWSMC